MVEDMELHYHAHLQRRDSDKNLARWHELSVQRGWFGQWSRQRAWGRLGQRSGREYAT